jgi:predicted acetyltransferase
MTIELIYYHYRDTYIVGLIIINSKNHILTSVNVSRSLAAYFILQQFQGVKKPQLYLKYT